MAELLNQLLQEFTLIHDGITAGWSAAMQSGDTNSVNRMADNYYVAFFRAPKEQPMIFQTGCFNRHQSVSPTLSGNREAV